MDGWQLGDPSYDSYESDDESDKSEDSKCNGCIGRSDDNFVHFKWRCPVRRNEIKEEVSDFLLKLDTVYLVISQICSYLPLYHLETLKLLFEEKSAEWTTAINAEILKRTDFNWLNADLEICRFCCKIDSTLKLKEIVPRYSSNLFRTRSTNILIFYDDEAMDRSEKVLCDLPQTNKQETKSFVDFLHHDISLRSGNRNVTSMSFAVQNTDFLEPFSPCHRTIKRSSSFCAIYFPQIPHVNILQFEYGKASGRANITNLISAHEKLECLLVFTTSQRPSTLIKAALKHLGQEQPINITFGGGCVWQMESLDEGKNVRSCLGKSELYCIAFKTCKNVDSKFFSASIVLNDSLCFETKVVEFKRNLEEREEQILFRFCCFAKDSKFDEDEILRRHFNCPITQMEVNGEIGIDHYTEEHRTNVPDAVPAKKRKVREDYFHGYTTILVYISWGNLKSTAV